MKIAAIIPTYRRGKYLVETLKMLKEQTMIPDEILVLDQTPLEEYESSVIEFLESGNKAGDFRWIRLSEPAVSKARNRAVLETQCDILLYLDDDIIPYEKLVENHLRHYTNQNIYSVTGGAPSPGNNKQIPPSSNFRQKTFIQQSFSRNRENFNIPMEKVGFIYANNFSVRRDALISIGGWDEHIINYGDRDLGIRLATAGFRIDFDPEASIYHLCAPAGGTRVTDSATPWKGWQRCISAHYVGIRHLKGEMFLIYGLYTAARFSFLLKNNLLRPWRLPFEVFSFLKAFIIARRWAKEGVKSPFKRQRKLK